MRPLFAACVLLAAGLALPAWPEDKAPAVPEDLLDDEHFREEMGINELTTPSIRRIFDQLAELGKIPYDEVQMAVTPPPAEDRVAVALHLGVLIANGFLSVQCERFPDMETLGKAVLEHAELLGTGKHLRPHSKALLEHASLRQAEKLKEELLRTQRDIEREMADLRDVDIAHLVSLGGWIRAFQIGCATVGAHFSPETAAKLARTDITAYYLAQLGNLHPKLKERESIATLIRELTRLQEQLDVPEGTVLTETRLAGWRKQGDKLVEILLKPKQAVKTEKKD